jgi:hypothetical protein
MLHKDRILKIESNQDKLGLLSSRSADLLMRGKELGKEAQDYILNKVGEVATGITTERIFGFSEQYDWQISYEAEALAKYASLKPKDAFFVQFPTISNGNIFIAEPTAIQVLIVNQKNPDEYLVHPVYCKCPRDFGNYIKYTQCETPQHLKETFPTYYWRMIDLLLVCEAGSADFFIFHPLFDSEVNYHTISFDRLALLGDMNKLKDRKAAATRMYRTALEKLSTKE